MARGVSMHSADTVSMYSLDETEMREYQAFAV